MGLWECWWGSQLSEKTQEDGQVSDGHLLPSPSSQCFFYLFISSLLVHLFHLGPASSAQAWVFPCLSLLLNIALIKSCSLLGVRKGLCPGATYSALMLART